MKAILENLKKIEPPRMIREAMALYGTIEYAGVGNNPIILSWAKETKTKTDDWYNSDSIAWCGLFMAVVAQRAGYELPNQHLRALQWASFGRKVSEAVLGDVLVFKRNGGGHVGLYVGETLNEYYVLGGNQSDRVCITRIKKDRIYDIRRPIYKIGMPKSCIKYIYDSMGEVSNNEG